MKALLRWLLTILIIVGSVGEIIAKVMRANKSLVLNQPFECSNGDSTNVQLVGSRLYQPLDVFNAVSAVDVLPLDEFKTRGQVDLSQLLQFFFASYSSNRQSGSSLSDHVDPFVIKGFGPDEILVLINGKRRHQSSIVNLNGTQGKGNANIDLNAIPIAAIERIEYLKEGSSGQYGTDAIAGVINIVLKSFEEGLSLNTNTGITSLGDGLVQNYAANLGLPLGERGQILLTADYLNRGALLRSPMEYYGDSPRKEFGEASGNRSSLWYNAIFPLKRTSELYSFGGFTLRNTDAAGWNIISTDSSQNVYSIYPLGYSPMIHSTITDYSFVAGFRTSFENGWDLDLSESLGGNSNSFGVSNTVNPSLGSLSPTSFRVGSIGNVQHVFNVSISRLYNSFLSGLSLSMGIENRYDNFWIHAGEEASWKKYPSILEKEGSSQGMPGFKPTDEQSQTRNTMSVFFDNELSVLPWWTILLATRADHASDVGLQFSWKVATRIELSKFIAFKASMSSNFKIPSLVNQYYSWTYNVQEAGSLIPNVSIKGSDSDIINALGVEPILAEKSINMQAGLSLKLFKGFQLSVDAYKITMNNRVVLTEMLNPARLSELEPIFTKYNIYSLRFFANMLATETQGIDVKGTWNIQFGKHTIVLGLGFSYNEFLITKVNSVKKFEGKEDLLYSKIVSIPLIEAQNLPYRGLYSLDYSIGRFSLRTSATVYAPMKFVANRESNIIYQPKVTTNISVDAQVAKFLTITAGGNNIAEMYPTKQYPSNTFSGGLYDAVQMGFGGAYYYAKLSFKF